MRGTSRKAALLMAGALVAGALVSPAAASHGGPGNCATPMPTSEVRRGMIGTGYTVVRGETPGTFSAEVLGVQQDGIGPGRDMIVVDVSGPEIAQAGGIWYGMSGSPIYVEGKLIGALAYGLSFGATTIAGLTPAEDLLRLADRPVASASADVTPRLSDSMVARIATATGTSPRANSDEMSVLKSPLSVSGLAGRSMAAVRKAVERQGLPLIAHSGSAASSSPAPAGSAPEPGGNFAAAISYGDVTMAGVGTTSFVCDGKAVAFGHPFFGLPQGKVALGANAAEAITIVKDAAFGPYKLANIGGTLGILDQDRFAGIRALLGAPLSTIPVASSVTAEGDHRDGLTEVLASEFVPFIAFGHLLSNIDFTLDRVGSGHSAMSWTVSGTRESGAPWSFTRSNVYSSDEDVALESIFELSDQLFTLYGNRFEKVEFTGVDIEMDVDEGASRYEIASVLVSKDGVAYADLNRIRVKPGARLFLRVLLRSTSSPEEQTVDMKVRVPRAMRNDGYLEIRGGGLVYEDEYYCLYDDGDCGGMGGPKLEDFDALLSSLQDKPRNDHLTAELRGARGGLKASARSLLDRVVSGYDSIYVRVGPRRTGASSSGEEVAEQKPAG